MILILLGAPGAGKGTQGALLAERLGMPKIATGDILRDAVRRGTELGRKAREYMDAGELVPDEVILGLVRDALASEEAAAGAILDGFPRNVPQAEALQGMLKEMGAGIDAVVEIDVDDEEIVRRISGRRSCADCGRVFNVHSDPPAQDGVCGVCGGALVQRDDDREETVRRRLEVYRASTAPLVEFYRSEGARMVRVDGDRPIEGVQREIVERLPR
jgi:adenylate kinase